MVKYEAIDELIKMVEQDGISLDVGQNIVCRIYEDMQYETYNTNYLVINDAWVNDMDCILTTLQELGINEFVYAEQSVASLEVVYTILKAGYKVKPFDLVVSSRYYTNNRKAVVFYK